MNYFVCFLTLLTSINGVKTLNCYSCTFNFNDVYDMDAGWCANDTLLEMPKKEVVRPCAEWETQCSTAIMTTLNSFTSITRGCAVSCPDLCESVGYGQSQVTCSECCTTSLCNKETNVTHFLQVMDKQYTEHVNRFISYKLRNFSWFSAFPEEMKYNREQKLRFPY
ncbi:Toxin-TOLIP domain-containing protein [Aphelenchoides besseyi]|nr:Toxin-TOLIP domain-containing protein [Aphelenchoides besseyi]KAI6209405.1 Toxin-TOLIP domain-containing protein [Aphelenchoides besseyi]